MTQSSGRPTTGREIEHDLTERIRIGDLRVGDRLEFGELRKRYGGVSQSTVQRVMIRLDALGLAEFLPGRGWYIRSVPDE